MDPKIFKKYEQFVKKQGPIFESTLESIQTNIEFKERSSYVDLLDEFIGELERTRDSGQSPVVGFNYIISRIESLKEKVLEQ